MVLIRTFFAQPLSLQGEAQLQREVAALQAYKSLSGLRWVAPQNYHITLAFLGDVRESAIETLTAIAAELAPRAMPCSWQFRRLAWFPSAQRPRALVALADPEPRADLFQRQLVAALRAAGFNSLEKGFRAHITLARAGRGLQLRPDVEQAIAAHPLALTAELDELVLYASTLRPGGSSYTVLHVEPLGSPPMPFERRSQ